jgi:hypothetical protein
MDGEDEIYYVLAIAATKLASMVSDGFGKSRRVVLGAFTMLTDLNMSSGMTSESAGEV